MEFIKENIVALLTPVLVAIVTGVFYLLKKNGNSKKQVIKNVNNSHINQAGDSQEIQDNHQENNKS